MNKREEARRRLLRPLTDREAERVDLVTKEQIERALRSVPPPRVPGRRL